MSKLKIALFVFIAVAVVGSSVGFVVWATRQRSAVISQQSVVDKTETKFSLKKFSSEAEFKAYFEQNSSSRGQGAARDITFSKEMAVTAPMAAGVSGSVDRVSETNVQVRGIDEPDIVKTDGNKLFYSPQNNFYPMPLLRDRQFEIGMPDIVKPMRPNGIKSIKPFPISSLKTLAEIDKNGEMLLFGNTLVIFSPENKIYGFDVARPESPTQRWVKDLGDNTSVVGSRKYNGQLYLVTQTTTNHSAPCPVRPMSGLTVMCTEVYYPVLPSLADATFTILRVDPLNGEFQDNTSFVGSVGGSILYVSGKNLYLTNQLESDPVGLVIGFVRQNTDVFSAAATDRILKLEKLDISPTAKATELGVIINKYFSGLSDDERLRLQNELNNRLSTYVKDRAEDLEKTGVSRITLDDFSSMTFGVFPGSPLNQFSMDEYKGNLRVAVTMGQNNRFWGVPFFSGQVESRSGVYVFDENLKKIGSVSDLGLGERIYATRFMGDQGYLVTFRQTDPFYVLDLKDPTSPKMAGQLKIPGYSAYLEEIKLNTVLGVGMEGSEVKLSLFDVSNPANPIEADKYLLSEYWTEVNNNHHAFLLDRANNVFFLPGGKGGYIFSYLNNKLKLVKALSETNLRRAIYINNYYYLLSDQKITVLSAPGWDEVASLEL